MEIYAALAEFGAPLEGLTPGYFADREAFFRMGHAPVGGDILTEIPGVDFDAAWEKRMQGVVDPNSGLIAYFILGKT